MILSKLPFLMHSARYLYVAIPCLLFRNNMDCKLDMKIVSLLCLNKEQR